jgi:hypothetical protein
MLEFETTAARKRVQGFLNRHLTVFVDQAARLIGQQAQDPNPTRKNQPACLFSGGNQFFFTRS